MKSFVPSLYKFILGMFLLGLAFFANPIEGYARTSRTITNTTLSLPYSDIYRDTFNDNTNGPLTQYGLVPFSNFDVNFSISFSFNDYTSNFSTFSCVSYIDVDVLFSGPGAAAYSQKVCSLSLSSGELDNFDTSSSFNFSYNCSVEGIPTGLRVTIASPYVISYHEEQFINGNNTVITTSSDSVYAGVIVNSSFTNFSFDQSSSGGGSTVINNVNSNLTPVGYSSLNFGVNGNVYFLEDNYIFKPDYIAPLMFLYDFTNSPAGTVSSSALTLCMGDIASVSPVRGSPIAVIGDSRKGEYELTLGFCLGSSPNPSELSALIDLSNWGFEFNRGYSGDQFPLPSDTRISYTNFLDINNGLFYVNVYFYFSTPDYFDSFMIRKAPSLRSIRVGAFAFNKYTGTISDQLTQSNQQWDYQNPSHSSFSSANSSAASTVSAFSNIESDAFNNLDTAMSGAGVNDFNINVISTPLATVSAMINQTYNILPDVVKWLLLAILVIGIFAAIISSNNYVNKDP